jgi:co-chaperonin GroES (HSP10)
MMTNTEDKTLFLATDVNKLGEATELPKDDEQKAKQLPDPSGYRILCAIPDVDEKTEGGLFKADVTRQYEELTTPVLFVLKIGPDAYTDKTRFPSGPWCKEGDFILTRPMAGSRVKIHGREFRLINDDSVEAVVEDPRGISRA